MRARKHLRRSGLAWAIPNPLGAEMFPEGAVDKEKWAGKAVARAGHADE